MQQIGIITVFRIIESKCQINGKKFDNRVTLKIVKNEI